MNVIVNRVSEFLKGYPPFSFLSKENLSLVAQSVEVRYFEKGAFLFQKGNDALPHFLVLKEGKVELLDGKETKEYCEEGDVFGVLALLGKRPYLLSAKAVEDSLIYAVPVEIFEEILQQNSKVALYFAAGFASGQVVVRQDLSQGQIARKTFKTQPKDHSLLIFSDQSQIKVSENVRVAPPHISIQQAAKLMSDHQVSSLVLVDERRFPLGIITDKDLRNKVVSKAKDVSKAAKEIMSTPVVTQPKNADFSDLYLTMIKHRLHHLILTEDGTVQSPVCGIISDHDVLLSMGNSPAVLIHALNNADSLAEMRAIRDRAEQMLRYYLDNEVAMDFVSSVMTEINDTIIQKATERVKKELDAKYSECKTLKFAFLSLGSEGREEQLLRTDQDNALIYEDVPENQNEQAHTYFLTLGTGIVETLIACGFASCPGEMMASNPLWVQPLSQWKNYFSDWILTPTQDALLKASIFFDFRSVAGDSTLANSLSQHIYDSIQKKKAFLSFLGVNALKNPPPLGFFEGFVVEKSGEHRDQFDIKARAMMPLADLARLLILSHGVVGINNTFRRFERLAELEPQQAELYSQAGKAYEILMRMRALEGLQHGSSGRYIDPESLGKIQRQLLKNAFSPISELQQLVEIRFQLAYFRT
ncbi:DUF294 nucleotidyltransferase-like domain-containing protein [Algoriphagus hitonicola]|uniref:CBS domain-containing protein n=1 Tax=Algoriphagus hitonicola TaxID=435880 RepID=A0A1I2QH05_9BACT|nr:DUF294 nucleotidyltransferase-like domain-containing protein [Algoriphagus hitonicola]SFG27865.1 CBS domain-containing protein [Algoriphagus hitonicola]